MLVPCSACWFHILHVGYKLEGQAGVRQGICASEPGAEAGLKDFFGHLGQSWEINVAVMSHRHKMPGLSQKRPCLIKGMGRQGYRRRGNASRWEEPTFAIVSNMRYLVQSWQRDWVPTLSVLIMVDREKL
jgi:hypothetical protein